MCSILARVTKVVSPPGKPSYVVTKPLMKSGDNVLIMNPASVGIKVRDSVTFTLGGDSSAWDNGVLPKASEILVLSELVEGDRGWRANKARFATPQELALVV